MKGNYVLVAKLAHNKDIIVGKLGYVHFPKDALETRIIEAMTMKGFVICLKSDEPVGQDKYAHSYKQHSTKDINHTGIAVDTLYQRTNRIEEGSY